MIDIPSSSQDEILQDRFNQEVAKSINLMRDMTHKDYVDNLAKSILSLLVAKKVITQVEMDNII